MLQASSRHTWFYLGWGNCFMIMTMKMHQEFKTPLGKWWYSRKLQKCSNRTVQKQYLTNLQDDQEWEKLRRQLYVGRKATVKRAFWNKLSVLPLLHSILLATAVMDLHMLRFQCSKKHLSFYSHLTAGAAERCESFLSYTNTGYNMEKIHPA